MKIKFSDGKEEDTKDMTDQKADIFEAIQNLIDVLQRYDSSFYLMLATPGKDDVMGLSGGQRFKSKKELAVLLGYLEKNMLARVNMRLVPIKEFPPGEDNIILE